MPNSVDPLHFESQVVVGRTEPLQLLLLPGTPGWRLPAFHEDGRHYWQEIGHVNRWLREDLGAPALALRCLAINYWPEHELVSKLYAATLADPDWQAPPGARWVTAEEFGSLALDRESLRSPIYDWFAWYGDPTAQRRTPWYMPGWHLPAVAWASAQLEQAGTPPTGPSELFRSWQRAAMMRLPTADGPAYLKVVPPIFRHEPALTAALAAAAPAYFAPVVAIDAERGWLLMRELRGNLLDRLRNDGDVATWQKALACFAEVQITTRSRLPELRALGVPERPLAHLASQLGPLLADPAATLPGRPAGLSPDERTRLALLAARIGPLADALAGYGLPASLDHGDFWAGQVLVGEHGFGFLDWSDSSITHPFFSLLLFLLEVEDYFPRVPEVRERLRDAYLEPWAAQMRGVPLVRAFELAQPLAALHHALAYHRVVLPHIEVKWEMELMLPFYLKMALRLAA